MVAPCSVKPVQLYMAFLGGRSAKIRAERRTRERLGKVRGEKNLDC